MNFLTLWNAQGVRITVCDIRLIMTICHLGMLKGFSQFKVTRQQSSLHHRKFSYFSSTTQCTTRAKNH